MSPDMPTAAGIDLAEATEVLARHLWQQQTPEQARAVAGDTWDDAGYWHALAANYLAAAGPAAMASALRAVADEYDVIAQEVSPRPTATDWMRHRADEMHGHIVEGDAR